MSRIVLVVIALSLVFVTAQVIFAQGQTPPGAPPMQQQPGFGGPPQGQPQRPMPQMPRQSVTMTVALPPPHLFDVYAQRLEITPDQTAKVKEVIEKLGVTLRPLNDKLVMNSQMLRSSVFDTGKDGLYLRKLVEEVQKIEMQVVDAEIAGWINLRSILSAEQIKKLEQMVGGPGMMPPHRDMQPGPGQNSGQPVPPRPGGPNLLNSPGN